MKIKPLEFIRQVKQEAVRITWPTRRETMITTGMVFILVAVAAVFFFIVDRLLAFGVKGILGIGW